MSGEPQTPAVTPEPQAQASELPQGTPPADGGAAEVVEGAQPAPQETQEDQDKKKQRFDKRFSDLSRAAREAELRAARLEGELAALRNMPRQPEPAPQAPAAAPAAPNPADPKYKGGKFDEQYVEDFAAWKAERAVEAAMEAAEKKRVERERSQALDAEIARGAERLEGTLDAARQAAAGEQGEFFQNAERVLELAYVPVPQGGLPRHVVDLITEADNHVHVAEVLGRQPERLRELRTAHPLKAAKMIGALDASISANLKARQTNGNGATPAPKPAPQPSPVPIPTVTSAGAAPSKDPNKMSMDEYVAWRDAGGGT